MEDDRDLTGQSDSGSLGTGSFGDPQTPGRRWKDCLSPYLYRERNAIERMFGRIKDFRRIATRYDRLALNFLAAICLVATICYWL